MTPNQEVLTASGDKLKILGRGNFLMRLDDAKDMVVQALVAQITVDGIIGLGQMTLQYYPVYYSDSFSLRS
jgi:hypothetical protein